MESPEYRYDEMGRYEVDMAMMAQQSRRPMFAPKVHKVLGHKAPKPARPTQDEEEGLVGHSCIPCLYLACATNTALEDIESYETKP